MDYYDLLQVDADATGRSFRTSVDENLLTPSLCCSR